MQARLSGWMQKQRRWRQSFRKNYSGNIRRNCLRVINMARTANKSECDPSRIHKRRTKRVRSRKGKLLADLHTWFAAAHENEIAPMIWDVCDAIDAGLSKQMRRGLSGLVLARIRGIYARESLKKEEGGHISVEDAARRLQMTREQTLKRYREGLVVGWRDGRQVRFPVWQFAKHGLLPGMQTVLEAIRQTCRNDDWARMLFFLAKRGSLEGRRPLDLVREGKIAQTLNYVNEYEN